MLRTAGGNYSEAFLSQFDILSLPGNKQICWSVHIQYNIQHSTAWSTLQMFWVLTIHTLSIELRKCHFSTFLLWSRSLNKLNCINLAEQGWVIWHFEHSINHNLHNTVWTWGQLGHLLPYKVLCWAQRKCCRDAGYDQPTFVSRATFWSRPRVQTESWQAMCDG